MKLNHDRNRRESFLDALYDIKEPTDKELQDTVVPNDRLEIAWCGGSPKRGCGNKFNLFHVKYFDGFAVCPFCGKLN